VEVQGGPVGAVHGGDDRRRAVDHRAEVAEEAGLQDRVEVVTVAAALLAQAAVAGPLGLGQRAVGRWSGSGHTSRDQ